MAMTVYGQNEIIIDLLQKQNELLAQLLAAAKPPTS